MAGKRLSSLRATQANGVPIIGTSPDMIDCAEDRERFQKMLQQLGLRQPPNRTARNPELLWLLLKKSATRW